MPGPPYNGWRTVGCGAIDSLLYRCLEARSLFVVGPVQRVNYWALQIKWVLSTKLREFIEDPFLLFRQFLLHQLLVCFEHSLLLGGQWLITVGIFLLFRHCL